MPQFRRNKIRNTSKASVPESPIVTELKTRLREKAEAEREARILASPILDIRPERLIREMNTFKELNASLESQGFDTTTDFDNVFDIMTGKQPNRGEDFEWVLSTIYQGNYLTGEWILIPVIMADGSEAWFVHNNDRQNTSAQYVATLAAAFGIIPHMNEIHVAEKPIMRRSRMHDGSEFMSAMAKKQKAGLINFKVF